MTSLTPIEDENKYGVSKWLIDALKSYDGAMSSPASEFKGSKMKAKRDLEAAITAQIQTAEQAGAEKYIQWSYGEKCPTKNNHCPACQEYEHLEAWIAQLDRKDGDED